MKRIRSTYTLLIALLALVPALTIISCDTQGKHETPPDTTHTEEPVQETPELGEPIDIIQTDEVTQDRAAALYCTYRVVTANGPNCGPFAPGALICVDCPSSQSCPGAAGGRSMYRLLDRDGNVLCEGEWAKRFNTGQPNACLDCPIPPGIPGFQFL